MSTQNLPKSNFTCKETQPFGGNATATYRAGGLLGHSGRDFDCGHGSDIYAYWGNEYVYKVLTKENPANDGSGFTGVFTICEKDGEVFEFLYGHCDPLPNLVGKTLNKGDLLGKQSNNGEVYSNGVRITLEMQKAGDTRGTHRHDQKRILRKDKSIQPNTRYISALGGGYYFDGSFYAIPFYDNGYNGCVDFKIDETESPFIKLMKAVKDFQLSEGIRDFANENNLAKIRIGNKTLNAIRKYYK